MLLKNATAVSALALFFAASPALAADILGGGKGDPAGAEYQAPRSWSGPWIGVVGGLSFFNTETTFRDDDYDFDGVKKVWVHDPSDSDSLNIDGLGAEGLFGEVQIGYDHQVGTRLIIGALGGVNLSDAEFSASANNGTNKVFDVSADYEWGGIIGGRLGYLKSLDTMFYVAGGWAYAQLGDTVGNVGGKPSGDFVLSGPELNGWFGEVGMETRVSDNVFLTVAGRYTDYGSETLAEFGTLNPNGTGNDDVQSIEIDTDSLSVMVGLKAKFGGLGGF